MDNTGENLAHVAKEIEDGFEKQSIHSSDDNRISKENVLDEKRQPSAGSSQSSSQDAPGFNKIDSQIVKVSDTQDEDQLYAHLPPHEREIIKRQLNTPSVPVNFFTLFRYATRNDHIIMYVSAVCAIAGGAIQPLMTVSYNAYESDHKNPG